MPLSAEYAKKPFNQPQIENIGNFFAVNATEKDLVGNIGSCQLRKDL